MAHHSYFLQGPWVLPDIQIGVHLVPNSTLTTTIHEIAEQSRMNHQENEKNTNTGVQALEMSTQTLEGLPKDKYSTMALLECPPHPKPKHHPRVRPQGPWRQAESQ